MINRSMAALVTMLPGAREVPATVSAKGQSPSWVSVGGGGGQNVVMVVDGVDNKEDHCGGASLAYSLDGIQEFQVFKTGAQAEYGRGTAAILVATKSGTNRFSGSMFGFFRNQDMVANDYFSKPGERRVGRAAVPALAGRRLVRRSDRPQTAPGSSARSNTSARTSSGRGRCGSSRNWTCWCR